MSRRKKINKFKVAIAIFALIVFFLSVTGLGKFVYNAARDRYLSSKKFYFESDLLSTSEITTTYQNWDGLGIYEVNVNMYSKKNNLERYEGELKYSVTLTYNSNYILCALEPDEFDNHEGGSVTDRYTEDEGRALTIPVSNDGNFTIYVKASGKSAMETIKEKPDTNGYNIYVTAYTSEPYTKTLKGKINLKITDIDYDAIDQVDVPYVILNVSNKRSHNADVTVKLSDTGGTSKLRFDMTDNAYIKSIETDPTSGIIKSVTFEMEKESSKNIKFYKAEADDAKVANRKEELLELFEVKREMSD